MLNPGQMSGPPRPRILVVDDDPPVREMVVRVLAGEGYAPVPAANGEEALHVAETAGLDLVLLDLGLPGKDGWDVLAGLTRLRPGLPVIILTAWPDQAPAARAAGSAALFEKPLDFPLLLETVARLLADHPAPGLDRPAGHIVTSAQEP